MISDAGGGAETSMSLTMALYRKKNTGPFDLDIEGVDCILFYSVYSFMMYSYMVYLLYVVFHNGLY